ncbi:MAG: NUDIX hydrolase [Bacteroidota bacterium]|nr:NUDIX hydrolase [Bacteroidota bacterium]
MPVIHPYKKFDEFLIAVDCIIFGFDGETLKALFVKRGFEPEKGRWSLMGGFAKLEETIDQAAIRILELLTGLNNIYMEQLYCFGDLNRDPAGRVVSIAYFAVINIEEHSKHLLKTHNAKWFPIDKVPALVFDHKKMLLLAKDRLKQRSFNHPVGFELLPAKFTLQQLQNLYEAIFESSFDKRNFIKKILSLDILQKLNEKNKGSSKKGSFYYIFDEKKYKKLEKEGVKFI